MLKFLKVQNTFDIAPILQIFEILVQTTFVEKYQDDQNQLTLSLICQHITLRIYNIINCYIMNKVLLVVE